MEATGTAATFGAVELALEFEINAPRERVWKIFTEEISEWWHKEFVMLNPKGSMKMEAWAGGRVYEENEAGDAIFWWHIVSLVRNSSMIGVGHLSPPWGGPATLHMAINFEDLEEGKTKMTVNEYMYGVVSEKLKQDMHDGWMYFFTDGFIPYVEGK